MCGINWFIKNIKKQDAEDLIKKMNKSIVHRGPDDQGFFCQPISDKKTIWQWQVRLAIIDITEAWFQPMFYDKNVWCFSEKHNKVILSNIWKDSIRIVFNWEIYNYQEIRDELVVKWYKFSSNSDTEVILASYLEWWENCVSRFNGMRAFAIYNPITKELFCSRDRFGKKPFYYYFDNDQFVFSSELKWILKNGVLKKISEIWLQYYLTYWYIPAPYCIFENIYKLENWSNLLYKDNIVIKKYYEIETKKENSLSFEENKKILMEKLEKAIEYRLISDVPVWTFLSWWIDSSLVSLITKKKFWKKNLHTFSIGFDVNSYNETHFAKIVADDIWSIHHSKILWQEESLNILKKLPKYYDEPFADSSMIPTFAVSELARKHVTVSLSWDWADELLWWYLNYVLFYYLRTINRVLLPWFKHITQSFWKFLTNIMHPAFEKKWLALWLKSLQFLDHNKDYELFSQINSLHVYCNKETMNYFKKYFKSDWRNNSMTTFLNTHLINDFFVKVDRAAMANALEVRSPFVDKDLVEFWLTIPAKYKIKIFKWYKYNLKYILKEAGKDYLPEKIYKRWKQWFWLPVAEYFNNEWKDFLDEKLNKIIERDILPISKKYILEVLEDHKKWKYDYFWFIYALLYLELWMEEWIDK